MVLVVEDEASSRRALQQLLKMHGYETRMAVSGEDAMQWVQREGPPQFAVVDINLPGMTGVEFVRELHRFYPSLPCVFMTANDEAHKEQLLLGGPDPILHKPFELSRLIHLIRDPRGTQAT